MQYLREHHALSLGVFIWARLRIALRDFLSLLLGLGLPCRPHHAPLLFGFVSYRPLLFYLNSSTLLFFCSTPLLLNSSAAASLLPRPTSPLFIHTSPPSPLSFSAPLPHYSSHHPHHFLFRSVIPAMVLTHTLTPCGILEPGKHHLKCFPAATYTTKPPTECTYVNKRGFISAFVSQLF